MTGKIRGRPIGTYRYRKKMPEGTFRIIDVDVYPLLVKKQLKTWRERDERIRVWFSQSDAAQKVREPKLKELIAQYGT